MKVAVWTATIHGDPDGFVVDRRTSTITYRNEGQAVGTRLEATGVSDDTMCPAWQTRSSPPATHSAPSSTRSMSMPASCKVPSTGACSRNCTHAPARRRSRRWRSGASTTTAPEGSPVDPVVSMLYRIGRDGDVIRHTLHAERAFPNTVCAGQIGYSAGKPLAPVGGLRRVFLFHPEPWSEHRHTELVQRVRAAMIPVRAAVRRLLGTALATLASAWSAFASGPEQYVGPFVDRVGLERASGGEFPGRFSADDTAIPLGVYLQLNGRFTDGHAALFRSERARAPREDFRRMLWRMAAEEGYARDIEAGVDGLVYLLLEHATGWRIARLVPASTG